MKAWTETMIAVATHAAVQAALARVAAGETSALEECLGAGRTCAEVRAAAESELRAWQADGEDEDALRSGSPDRQIFPRAIQDS